MRLDLRNCGLIDKWPATDSFDGAVARSHSANPFSHRFGELLDCVGMNIDPIRAYARLAGVEELERRYALRGMDRIGIGHHDERRVTTQLHRDPLE